jgi:hypothetical protein
MHKTIILPVSCMGVKLGLSHYVKNIEGVWKQGAEENIWTQDVAGGWKKLNNEELHNLYASPNIARVIKSRKMRWAWHVASIWEKWIQNFVRETWREESFGRRRRRWEGNSRMDIREVGWEGVDWMHRAQHRDQWKTLVNTVMNIRVP